MTSPETNAMSARWTPAAFDVPEPSDKPLDRTLRLAVDARDVTRGIFHVRMRVPVDGPGDLILLYPQWLPGFHSPVAPIELLAGLSFFAGDRTLAWRRHPTRVHAFAVEVPPGVDEIEAEFQFLSPTDPSQGRIVCTPDLLFLTWNSVVPYPAGYEARRIMVEPRLTLPPGWQAGSALVPARRDETTLVFDATPLDVLVDSPLLAGRHVRRIAIDDRVGITLAADQPHQLAAADPHIAAHRGVVDEADHLFGSRPFDRFEMLLALSDTLTPAGVEHHRSFEAVTTGEYFADWDSHLVRRDTVPHEYLHSWNGKHRRGAGACSVSFEQPMRNDLLWVYEGQTQYWTFVMCARSGLWSRDQTLSALAVTAARADVRPGSRWRPTMDTTRDPIIAARSPLPWTSWQRSEDYYAEGALLWLDIDTRLRALTAEAHSLDDFARTFFGGTDGDWSTRSYLLDDVIAALDAVAPHDWRCVIDQQISAPHERAPLEGLRRAGYRLVYRDQPNDYQRRHEAEFGHVDLTHSLGLVVSDEGRVTDVLWEGAAFDAGVTIGTTIIGVDGRSFTGAGLRRAVAHADRVALTVKRGDAIRAVEIAVSTGTRFPHLEPIPGAQRRLDAILAPRRAIVA